MFHSLYKRSWTEKTEETTKSFGPELPSSPWPATYREGMTDLTPHQWKLKIMGLVETPLTVTYEQLKKYPQVNQFRRIVSAEGWTYRTRWEGVTLKHLLAEVKPKSQAKFIRQVNASGHEEYLSLSGMNTVDLLLAVKESSKPLSPLHGGPVRLVVFDTYFHKGLGQITEIHFTDQEGIGFWEKLGYEKSGQFTPGKYYAFDLKSYRPIEKPGEVTY